MRSRSAAALAKVAAICGLLVVPGVSSAQLKCPEGGTEPRIRRVRFEGNKSFTGSELSLHVVSTPTDLTAQYSKPAIVGLAAVGATVGIVTRDDDKWIGGLAGAAVGAGTGFFFGSASGAIERCLRPGLLSGDISSIRGFYSDRGFPVTRVDTSVVIDGQWADITFRITEGDPVLIDVVTIPLDSALSDLGPKLNSQKGNRYSPLLLQQDIDSIETRLRNSGYPEAKALRDVSLTSPYTATVGLKIERGPFARIGRITLLPTGIDGRASVVDTQNMRILLRFDTGDIYSERALFESERSFYRVGSFLSTEVAPDLSHLYQDSIVDVAVRVVEDLPRTYSVEPGLGTLDCVRFRSEYSNRAFRRGLNRLDLSASVSKLGRANGGWAGTRKLCSLGQDEEPDISSREINYNGTIRYTRPAPLRGGLLPSLSLYTERRGGYKAFVRTTLIGATFTASKGITRTIGADASYTLEYGETRADEPVLCFVFRACDDFTRQQLGGNTRLAVAGIRLGRDQRNFPDSAFKGSFSRIEYRLSEPFLGSDSTLNFQKVVGDVGWYTRLFGAGVFAVRLRGGLITGGQSSAGGRLPPPQERLYTGGETTVRGFTQNQLGPLIYVTEPGLSQGFIDNLATLPDAARDSVIQHELHLRTIPTGGNAMVVGNFEYRLPLPFVRSLQAIFFVDVGALSTEGPSAIGEKQARWTPGFGVKYFSPIGPMQFNLGYNRYESVAGPVYLDQGTSPTLTCLSGTQSVAGSPTPICLPIVAKLPKDKPWKRLTFTLAFPPDF